MELINLRKRSGVVPVHIVRFGSHPHGIRCDEIKISPQEIAHFLSNFAERGIEPEETLRTLKRYINNLSICSTNLKDDRNE